MIRVVTGCPVAPFSFRTPLISPVRESRSSASTPPRCWRRSDTPRRKTRGLSDDGVLGGNSAPGCARMTVAGHCRSDFAPLRAALEENLNRPDEIGQAVSVALGGEVVADLWGGEAGEGRAWGEDTLACVFFGGKADRGSGPTDVGLTAVRSRSRRRSSNTGRSMGRRERNQPRSISSYPTSLVCPGSSVESVAPPTTGLPWSRPSSANHHSGRPGPRVVTTPSRTGTSLVNWCGGSAARPSATWCARRSRSRSASSSASGSTRSKGCAAPP